MNRKILFILLMSILVVGCKGEDSVEKEQVCAEYSGPMLPCRGNPQVPKVTINTEKFKVNPQCVRAAAGKTIKFRLVPEAKNEVDSAEIFPKDPENKWLEGKNNPDKDEISIQVPRKHEPGDHYDQYYSFRTSEGCIDPRVHVEN